ncbi:MAG: outer membrane protein assembly factor BamB [Rubrivivax sp.]|nr:outer membrane protein assembly factor BamB [Rubrivivax sp.]
MNGGARWRSALRLAAAGAALALAACASGPKREPAPLQTFEPSIAGRQVWQSRVGEIDFPLVVVVRDGAFFAAGGDGSVVALRADDGRELWRGDAKAALTAGVGSDGRFAAVVTRDNEVVVLEAGIERWRKRVGSRVVTPPLVAGERVFVMGVDRAVHAFDAIDGRRLWSLQRPGDALTLAQPGVLAAWRNTLLAGQGPRLAAIDPLRGTVIWEVPLASPRGTNEVERLADLVGPAPRVGDRVCARSFQSAVACADAARGALLWSRQTGGVAAVAADAERVYGTDASGRVSAWRVTNGDLLWSHEKLLYRQPGAALALGPTVVLGDFEGQVHFLSSASGEFQLRLPTDGSAIVGPPVLAGTTVLVATRKGGLFAFRPQ